MTKHPWLKSIFLVAGRGAGLTLQAGCGEGMPEEAPATFQHQSAALQDQVSATDVSVYIYGNKATGSYRYNSTANAAQSGTRYTWQRSSSASGTNPTTIATTMRRR